MAKSKKEMREMRQRQRQERRGKKRAEKRKYGRYLVGGEKKRAALKAEDMENRARRAQIAATESLIGEQIETADRDWETPTKYLPYFLFSALFLPRLSCLCLRRISLSSSFDFAIVIFFSL